MFSRDGRNGFAKARKGFSKESRTGRHGPRSRSATLGRPACDGPWKRPFASVDRLEASAGEIGSGGSRAALDARPQRDRLDHRDGACREARGRDG
jgi:hypothetical protein